MLINPKDIVAIPHEDNYGKLRCCAYMPESVVYYNNDDIIEDPLNDGVEEKYITDMLYTGTFTNKGFRYSFDTVTIADLYEQVKQNYNSKFIN